MNIFEKLFVGPKVNPEEIARQEREAAGLKPAAVIKQAEESIEDLQTKRQEILNKHRDTVEEIKKFNIYKEDAQGAARTAMENDALSQIEKDLVVISKEINMLRENFDLQPEHSEVLNQRYERLQDLRDREEAVFAKTPIGAQLLDWRKEIENMQEKIQEVSAENAMEDTRNILRSKSEDLKKKITFATANDEQCIGHQKRIDRIDQLMKEVSFGEYDTKSPMYNTMWHKRAR